MRLDTRRATRPLCLDGPAARNDQQPGRTNSRSSPLVISLARWSPMPCRLGTWPAATTAVNTNTTCRQGDRHPSPASVSITNPDDCRASYHRPRPGGLDDLPKPDSATHSRKKKALALVSGGKETDQRIHAPAGPVCLPFQSRTPPPPQRRSSSKHERRRTIPSSRWRCTRIANIEALSSPLTALNGGAARQSRMESAVLGLERESISSPPRPPASVDLSKGMGGRGGDDDRAGRPAPVPSLPSLPSLSAHTPPRGDDDDARSWIRAVGRFALGRGISGSWSDSPPACGWSMLMRASGDLRMPLLLLQEGFGRSGLCPPGIWGGERSGFFLPNPGEFSSSSLGWGPLLSGNSRREKGGEGWGWQRKRGGYRPPWRFVKRKLRC